MASNLFISKSAKETKPKAIKKHFKTSKEEQTAPIQTNATIYRAGQNPNKKHIDLDDNNDKYVESTSNITGYLQDKQQPTFVDVLKHRRDHLGRRITKHQILNTKHTPSQSIVPKEEKLSISNTATATEAQHSPENKPILNKTTDTNNVEDELSSDESSDDFDMNNLMVPKVETDTVETNTSKPNESDDIREKFKKRLQIQKEEEMQDAPVIVTTSSMNYISTTIKHDDEESDYGSSEYETASSSEESESEQRNPRNRKITFMNKKQRSEYNETTKKMTLDEQAEIVEEIELEREEKIKQETSDAVLDYIREQEKHERDGDKSDDEIPDDCDDLEIEEARKEFEAWKLREIKRNLRDETARQQREEEKSELERRRKMTDDEIMRENEKLGLNKQKKKGNMKFMQKYYHQGVFYRDGSIVGDSVLDRNFNAATGEDKWIDFEKVPTAMKRKNFGKMSQSKWTHLANEDTTFDKDEREWFKKKNTMNEDEKRNMKKTKYQFRHKAHENNFWFKRGGNGALDRPSFKKGNMESANRRFERTFDRKERDKMRGRDTSAARDRSKSPHRKSRR